MPTDAQAATFRFCSMSEEEADELFASIKLALDEVVATPEKPDRAVKAAVLLRLLKAALYGTTRTEEAGEGDENDEDEDDVDVIELLRDEIEALEAKLAALHAYCDDLERNAAVAAALKPLQCAGELPWAPQ